MLKRELRELARRYGIQLSYNDASGKRREVPADTVRAIAKAREDAVARARPDAVTVAWDREPYGYETLEDGSLRICAPRKAHPLTGKQWGLFLPLHSLGEDPKLDDLRAWREALGGDLVATLPLLAPMPGERSPYSPSSRLRWDERYGDLRALADSTPLYLDFPVGVHPDGEDVKEHRELFVKGMSVGAPHDSFFREGQNWGFPPLDPDVIREKHYDYFRAAIRHHVRCASILRIDHVAGLHRLWWIPEGASAKEGAYVHYRAEELYAILTLESRLHRCAIAGEDLGTVPPYVRQAMKRHGLRRTFVVQYERKSWNEIPVPPRESVASVNTHDMRPFAAVYRGKRDPLDALERILVFLARSDAEVVLVNPEDLWCETQPQNVPGEPEKSWKHRFRKTLEEAREDPAVRRILAKVSGARLA